MAQANGGIPSTEIIRSVDFRVIHHHQGEFDRIARFLSYCACPTSADYVFHGPLDVALSSTPISLWLV